MSKEPPRKDLDVHYVLDYPCPVCSKRMTRKGSSVLRDFYVRLICSEDTCSGWFVIHCHTARDPLPFFNPKLDGVNYE